MEASSTQILIRDLNSIWFLIIALVTVVAWFARLENTAKTSTKELVTLDNKIAALKAEHDSALLNIRSELHNQTVQMDNELKAVVADLKSEITSIKKEMSAKHDSQQQKFDNFSSMMLEMTKQLSRIEGVLSQRDKDK